MDPRKFESCRLDSDSRDDGSSFASRFSRLTTPTRQSKDDWAAINRSVSHSPDISV
jgi:hypothetical protein